MAKVRPTANGQPGDTEPVKTYVASNFPGAVFVDEHYGEVHFEVCFE
jgi:hypothetical protein